MSAQTVAVDFKPVRNFQPYDSDARALIAASFRLRHRQKESVGEYFWTVPSVPGVAFPTRKLAQEAADRVRCQGGAE